MLISSCTPLWTRVNLQTAKTIGFDVPPRLLALATKVIE
jgi:hypothetical protein